MAETSDLCSRDVCCSCTWLLSSSFSFLRISTSFRSLIFTVCRLASFRARNMSRLFSSSSVLICLLTSSNTRSLLLTNPRKRLFSCSTASNTRTAVRATRSWESFPTEGLFSLLHVGDVTGVGGLPTVCRSRDLSLRGVALIVLFEFESTVGCDYFSQQGFGVWGLGFGVWGLGDRKSTRLNSSHSQISYAVFCLKKTQHAFPVRTD